MSVFAMFRKREGKKSELKKSESKKPESKKSASELVPVEWTSAQAEGAWEFMISVFGRRIDVNTSFCVMEVRCCIV